MKKRYLILITVFALLVLFPLHVFAAEAVVTVNTTEAKPGDTVTLAVTIKDNPGFCYLKLNYSFDEEKLEFVKAENGTVSTDAFTAVAGALSWDSGEDAAGSGTLVSLTFSVKQNAGGTAAVSMRVVDCFNYDEEDVAVSVTNGAINIKNGSANNEPATSAEPVTNKEPVTTKPIYNDEPTTNKEPVTGNEPETSTEPVTNNVPVTNNGEQHVHTWDAGSVTKAATCRAEGVRTYACTRCSETKTETIAIDPSNHNGYGTEIKNAKAATESETGYTGDTVCKGCGAIVEKGTEIPLVPVDHTHTLIMIEAQAPTCTSNGTAAYYYCAGCGGMFSDAEGKEAISYEAVNLPMGHSFGEWAVTKPATATEDGVETRECTICHITETRVIPAAGGEDPSGVEKIISLKKLSLENNILRVAVCLNGFKGVTSGKLPLQYDTSLLRALPFVKENNRDLGADAIRLNAANGAEMVFVEVNTAQGTGVVDFGFFFKTQCETNSSFELAILTFEVADPGAVSTELTIAADCKISGETWKENQTFTVALNDGSLPGPAPAFTKGDVDGDGDITSSDARLALRAAVMLENYAEDSAQFLAADVDENKVIESSDARTILRVSVQLESF